MSSFSRTASVKMLILLSFMAMSIVGAAVQGLNFKFARKCLGLAGACVSLSISSPTPSAAIPAFEGAMNAMTMTREKSVVERDFEVLPEATKKRKALAACKDSSARSSAGYSSASQCSNAVLQGSYESIMKGASARGPETLPVRSAPAAASTAVAAKQTVNLKSSGAAPSRQAVAAVAEVEAPLKKKQDLSGVAPAAKKRRALAACKKPDTRKFARAGSESKCTESVMKGDYDNIIEALEYGR